MPVFRWRSRPRRARPRTLITGTLITAASLGAATWPAGHGRAARRGGRLVPLGRFQRPISQRVSQLLAAMSVAQKVTVLTGASGSSYVGFTPAIGALCIPAMNLEDGPAGVGDGMGNVTQLPAPVDVAATWDTSAERLYGQVIGAEQAAKGSSVDLGPTINIVRDPRWGRAFESIGEDPFLNGSLGAADIQGVQSNGVMAQVKHFAVYNQETNRNTASDDAVVSTRAEQEIYLPAFADSTQQGAASSVMCSYSTVNGTYACQNPYLLSTVLRQQFGFGGFVTSDWYATHATAASANAGLDQDMPGTDGEFGSALQSAVSSGAVSTATLNSMVTPVLTEMFAFGLFDEPPAGSPAEPATSAAHVADALQLAEEGTVLLKNSGGVLPLTPSDKSVAVIGADASSSPLTAGGGSAGVSSSGTVTPLQGITAAAPSGVTVSYNDGSSDSSAAALAASSSVAVVFVSNDESEGSDLSSIDLSSADNSLISAVAAANPHTIVVLNTGSAVTMPWLPSVAGVFEAWYPGQQDGNAIAALLFGSADPSGHLTVTFPASLSQVPAATAAQWTGTGGTVQYSEGIDVGYRWYNTKALTPLFPFGYGLSYTSFSFCNLKISALPKGGAASVSATVTDTGSRAGADVAQLYVTDPSAAGEPPRQLEGFARVNLQPGASQTVSFPLTQRNLSYWSSSSTVGRRHRELRHRGRRLGHEPAADRHAGRDLRPARPAPHHHQPWPAGRHGGQRGVGAALRRRLRQRPVAHLHRGRAARRDLDLRQRHHHRHAVHGGHVHGHRYREDAAGASAATSFTWTVAPAGLGRGDHPAGRLRGAVPGPDRRQQQQRQQGRDLHLQRHQRPAVDRGTRRDHPRGR